MASTISEVFAFLSAPYGGPLPREFVDQRVRVLLLDVLSAVSPPEMPAASDRISDVRHRTPRDRRTFVEYVRNLENNASAVSHENLYFVGVFSGLVARILRVVTALCASSSLFPDIGGDSSRSATPTLDLQSLVACPHVERASLHEFTPPVGPGDPERLQLAANLGILACQFVVMHELAHVLRGHLDYLQAQTGLSKTMEFGESAWTGLPSEVRQCLEIDADNRAALFLVGWICEPSHEKVYRCDLLGANVEQAGVRIATFIMGFVSALLADFRRFGPTKTGDSHPNPRIRFLMGNLLLTDPLINMHRFEIQNIEKGRELGWQDTRIACACLGLSLSDLLECTESVLLDENERVQKLGRIYDEHIRPQLKMLL